MTPCNKEVPIAIEKPLYYTNFIPTPCYRKKYIPEIITKRCPVFIKKCVPVHIPVKVPVQVPIDVIVPCKKVFTQIVPVCKTIYKSVPHIINKYKTITERVPKVCHIREARVHHRTVIVPTPFKVIDRIRVTHSCAPCAPPMPAPSCSCSSP